MAWRAPASGGRTGPARMTHGTVRPADRGALLLPLVRTQQLLRGVLLQQLQPASPGWSLLTGGTVTCAVPGLQWRQ